MSILHWPGHDLFGVCVDMFEILMQYEEFPSCWKFKRMISLQILSTPTGTMVVGDEST